jgi:hypothetical protein
MAMNDIKTVKVVNAQVINDLNAIKAQMGSIAPIDYPRLLAEISNLITSNVNISPELLRTLESMKSTIENHQQNAHTIQISEINNNKAMGESDNARDCLNAFLDNEMREKELIAHKAEFNGFKAEFQRTLSNNNSLLKKVADGAELTKEEQDQLNYPSQAEHEKLADQWQTTYQIHDKTLESIEYNKKQLKVIDQELTHPDNHPLNSEKLLKSKAHYLSEIEKHQECLEKDIKPCIKARDEEREHLHNCVRKGKHDKVKNHLKAHCHHHIEHYKKEYCNNPNHKALHEMRDMIKQYGLHQSDSELKDHLMNIEKYIELNNLQKYNSHPFYAKSSTLVPDKTPIVRNKASKNKNSGIVY